MNRVLVNITLADVFAKMSCSSIIFCTSPWKSLQVGHAGIIQYMLINYFTIGSIMPKCTNNTLKSKVLRKLVGQKEGKKHTFHFMI